MVTPSPAKAPTAQQAVLAELRRSIAGGRLRPGQQLTQDGLALELGVSRVPLREALKILEGEGQVTYEAHRGYFVARLSLDDLLEVYRLRTLLESEALRRALPRTTAESVGRVVNAQRDVAAAAAANDLPAMSAANRRFHFAVMEPCGMGRLLRFVRILWDSTDAYRSVYYTREEHRSLVLREHEAAIEAVRAGDADRLVSVMDAHRDNSVAALRTVLVSAS